MADSGGGPRHAVAEPPEPAGGPRLPGRELGELGELGELRPLALGACRRIVVVAPHPRDEIRAVGGLLRRLVSGRAEVDVLSLTDPPSTARPAPPEGEHATLEAYRSLGLGAVRRHRLALPSGRVAAYAADVVGAISEIVGFSVDPEGLCVVAPGSGDGDDDHEAAGRAAESVCAAYRIRLVRWPDQAWTWAGPESSEPRSRRSLLSVRLDG